MEGEIGPFTTKGIRVPCDGKIGGGEKRAGKGIFTSNVYLYTFIIQAPPHWVANYTEYKVLRLRLCRET